MNKVKNLQQIKSNKQSKYNEIIEYLSQDNGYWLKNDKWDLTQEVFIGEKVKVGTTEFRYINFNNFENIKLKKRNKILHYLSF